MEHLKTLGIKTIVSLEDENGKDQESKEVKRKLSVELERNAAKNAGIVFLSHPMQNANFRTMSDKDILAWLEDVKKDILAASRQGGVLFHCAAGHDRSGLAAAYLRITMQHWTAEQAIKEMRDLGHNWPKYSSNGGKSSWHEEFLRRQFPAQTLGLISTSLSARGGENWPQFRGPTGLGYTEEKNLPLRWGGPADENVVWKSPLYGAGHASPIVWGERVFVCTVQWPGDGQPEASLIPDHHVTCYRVADGKRLWTTIVPPGPWRRDDFRSGAGGGYAGPTPVTDGKLIYCVFGSAVIAALDFQGKLVWRKEIVPYNFDVTVGSSPILYQDTVILLCAMANPGDSNVLAFDKADGAVKWQRKFPDMAFGHSTPVIVSVKEKPQMLVVASGMKETGNALRSLDPASGEPLWWCRGAGDAASPAFGSGIVYFDSGREGKGVAVDPSGSGDVSATHIRWTGPEIPEGISSPVIVGPHVYRLHKPDVVECWEAATGKKVYTGRLPGISTTWASPVADGDGRLYFASAGKSYVIQSGPEFRILAVNDLGDGNHPSPAVAQGRLFLVGLKNLYCIGQGIGGTR